MKKEGEKGEKRRKGEREGGRVRYEKTWGYGGGEDGGNEGNWRETGR